MKIANNATKVPFPLMPNESQRQSPNEVSHFLPAPEIIPLVASAPAPVTVSPVVRDLLSLIGRTRNIVLHGVPGTGKTYHALDFAKTFLGKAQDNLLFVAFHPAYTYDEFVGGARPGVFRALCIRAEAAPSRAFLVVIDGIDNTPVTSVFGELLTLLEDDKRLGETHALRVTLPLTGKPFGIPRNVFVLATASTANLSALDPGLRRRFAFVAVPPDPGLLTQTIHGVSLSALLTRLNRRISALFANECYLGHGYLMTARTVADLRFVWNHKIVPELFAVTAGDTARLRALLGTVFFAPDDTDDTLFDAETVPAIAPRYHLQTFDGDDDGFIAALKRLTQVSS